MTFPTMSCFRLLASFPTCLLCLSAAISQPSGARNEEAIQEVLSGSRTIANAAWWGFDREDSTKFLQEAIDSGARRVVVPYMGAPWVVKPIRLRGNLEIEFVPGVLILAKRDEFKGRNDCLFRASDASDITLRGYGATLRMRKDDYQSEDYDKAEWRMGLSFLGCKRVRVEGLRIESTGGDGIYIGRGNELPWCEDVVIRDIHCDNNHRQGISIISAVNLLIENCVVSNTRGTLPEAGIDFEPNGPDERLTDCMVRNCLAENNWGHGFLVYLDPLSGESEPVSIRFENCHSRMGTASGLSPEDFAGSETMGWSGMAIGAVSDFGPQGTIEFVRCTTENTGREGAKIYDKSADGVLVRFANCSWGNSWVSHARDYGGPRVPILVHSRRPEITERIGGIEFVDCVVYSDIAGPALRVEEDKSDFGARNISGKLTVHNPHGTWVKLGPNAQGVDIEIVE